MTVSPRTGALPSSTRTARTRARRRRPEVQRGRVARLLRGHVPRRSHQRARARQDRSRGARTRDAEIEEAHVDGTKRPPTTWPLSTLTPPPYPYPIDAALAAAGKPIFEASCATCHGTYGDGGAYPNVWVTAAYAGTDATLALGASQFAGQFVDWFAKSFYGEVSRLEPQKGYVAPPLDGVWATAPYLHNGSVPTIAGVLDSASRPTFFTRSYADDDYDPAAVGWRFTAIDHGQDQEGTAAVRARIYDTTKLGYGNGGHTFGDALSPAQRAAVLEYLKTL